MVTLEIVRLTNANLVSMDVDNVQVQMITNVQHVILDCTYHVILIRVYRLVNVQMDNFLINLPHLSHGNVLSHVHQDCTMVIPKKDNV